MLTAVLAVCGTACVTLAVLGLTWPGIRPRLRRLLRRGPSARDMARHPAARRPVLSSEEKAAWDAIEQQFTEESQP
jgi:hypothetical protein